MLVLWRRALALGAPLGFPAACRAPSSRAPGRAAPSAPFPVSRRLRFAPGVGGAPSRPPPSPGPPPPFLPRRFVSLRAAKIPYSHPFFLSSTVQELSEGSVIIYRVPSVGGFLGVVLLLAALFISFGWSGAVASGCPRCAAECPQRSAPSRAPVGLLPALGLSVLKFSRIRSVAVASGFPRFAAECPQRSAPSRAPVGLLPALGLSEFSYIFLKIFNAASTFLRRL
jgi:hypothetical protein